MIQKFVAEIEKTIDSSSIVLLSNIQKYFGPGEETVYLKGQLTIIDSSTLEISIFATETRETLSIDKYRLHYMNADGQMLFRYDNLLAFPIRRPACHCEAQAGRLRRLTQINDCRLSVYIQETLCQSLPC
ncbi:MAG: DUF6516 family protein [Desulfobacterales bacterium]